MRRLRRIKILATLGPASSDSAMIRKLFEAGADVFRINMSHTSHDKMRELVKTIRNVEISYGRPIGILVDLQGPKLRLGAFAEGSTQLKNGQSFVLDSDKTPGDNSRVQLPHPEILAALRPGHALLLDDGKVRLIAEETSPERAVTRVVIGGKMSDRKGVSLPDTDLPVSAMTPKDRADLEAALVTGVDWIALSFVQRAEDVNEAKRMIRGRAAVMAKIEKPQAIDRLAEILEVSDALMVARGDLGVELPLERVPSLQKQMTRMARRAGKPVVIATQMLESMIQSPVPTRAEVSDVATAVYEGADAIMLSAESAAGKFPVEAVSTMNRIGEEVERDPTYRSVLTAQRPEPEATVGDAIADAARQIAETLELSAIICWTSSGSTAIRVARERPKPPVVAITPNLATGRKLSVVWGVHCVVAEDAHDQDDMVDRAGSIAFRDGFAEGRPARHHRRRRAARHRRHHQHGAHRLCRDAKTATRRSDGDARLQLLQRRVQRDLRIQQFRHRAAGLRHARQFLKLRVVGAGDLRRQRQMNRGDRKTVAYFLQRDVGLGFHVLGGELGFAQDQRQRHGEAGGMRGADQFFRIGAGLALEAAGEAVGIVAERAALGRDRALAVLDAALPFGRSVMSSSSVMLLAPSVGVIDYAAVVADGCVKARVGRGGIFRRRPASSPAAPPAPRGRGRGRP